MVYNQVFRGGHNEITPKIVLQMSVVDDVICDVIGTL